MITKWPVIWFCIWAVLTVVLFGPEYLQRRRCEERHQQRVSLLQKVAYQEAGAPSFELCYVDGPLPVWKELLVLVWLALLIAWPGTLVQDVWWWYKRRRRSKSP